MIFNENEILILGGIGQWYDADFNEPVGKSEVIDISKLVDMYGRK